MNRSQKRKLKKQTKEHQKLAEKMTLFNKLPDECDTCKKLFDKKNKEMVFSWKVVVREERGIVRLYCPDCQNLAEETIEKVNRTARP